MNERMRKIAQEGEFVLWEYHPTLFRLLYKDIDKISYIRRIRLMMEYFSKGRYKVFYLEVNGKIVGYDVFCPGGRRLKCSTPKDLVSGPLYIIPQYRGLGYATILKKMILKYCCVGFDYVYSWIAKSNIASIKSYEKVGFDMDFGELKIVGRLRKLKQVEKGKGTNIIVRYKL